MRGESVDRETGEVTNLLDKFDPPRRRWDEETDPFAMLDDNPKKQGAGR